jgi:NAD(P)H dehydrogenase (quinone)
MKVLIVYAHPEPKSFNGALKDLAISVLKEQGHEVKLSDLYAMNFKAVADKEDFLELENPEFLKYQVEEKLAYEKGTFSPDIVAEQEKLIWADFVILQFPLWWFSVPAIMKGWVDRVFAVGFSYGGGNFYDKGGLKGKKAMLSLTTGGPPTMYDPTGINGDIHQILFPIHHGILYFVGMEVLPPFVAWSVARVGEEGRSQYLEAYKQRLLILETTPAIPYPSLADYDENFQLKQQL